MRYEPWHEDTIRDAWRQGHHKVRISGGHCEIERDELQYMIDLKPDQMNETNLHTHFKRIVKMRVRTDSAMS